MADEVKPYLEKLKVWGLMVAAILALSVASALAQRWLGRDPVLPPPPMPPVIVVQPGPDGAVPTVQVLNP